MNGFKFETIETGVLCDWILDESCPIEVLVGISHSNAAAHITKGASFRIVTRAHSQEKLDDSHREAVDSLLLEHLRQWPAGLANLFQEHERDLAVMLSDSAITVGELKELVDTVLHQPI